jgi:hypothetical protein
MNKDKKRPVQRAQVVLEESPPYVGSPVSLAAKAVRKPPPPTYLAGVHESRAREHTIFTEEHMNKDKKRSDRQAKVVRSELPPGVGSPPAASTSRRAGNPLTDPLPDDWSPRNVAIVEALRKDLWLMQRKVDYDVEVFNTLRSLDALYETSVKRGDLKGALRVMRERITLLSPGEHVKPVTEWDRRPREADPYDAAFMELDPADRESVRKRITAFEEEKKSWTYVKTGRDPNGSKKTLASDSADPHPESTDCPSGSNGLGHSF